MYTNSIEEEKKLYLSLHNSIYSFMNTNEAIKACQCPKCKNGDIYTTAKITTFQFDDGCKGAKYHDFKLICNHCHEEYDLNSINDDIFYHEPSVIVDELETPFGTLFAKCNENKMPLRLRFQNGIYKDEKNNEERIIPITIVDLDLSGFKRNDAIFFGLDTEILEYEDADEYEQYFAAENEESLFRIRVNIIEEIDNDDNGCSYDWPVFFFNQGFMYIMKETPALNSSNKVNHLYDHVSFQITWVKKDFKDPEKIYSCLDLLLDDASQF